MYTLIYGSNATSDLPHSELIKILETARSNNKKLGITGMLLYSGGNFLQILEGDKEAVESLYETIEKDPRHNGPMVYLRENIEERQFGDWEMGFVNADDVDLSKVPGYSDYFRNPNHQSSLSESSYAHSFLELFRDSCR